MKWPFGQTSDRRAVTLTLTDEEHQECQALLSSMIPRSDEGQWMMQEELIEPFKRNLVAFCMMGRAQRFTLLAQSGDLGYRQQACEAAAKACAVYPLSAYFYDFACILETLGNKVEARVLFAEFLRRHDAGPQNEVDRVFLDQRDVTTMLRDARGKVDI